MSAEFESGFFVRKPAWHRLGVVIDDYPGSWDEARKLAGLEWDVVEVPVFTREVEVDPFGIPSATYAEIPGQKGLARSDTGSILSVPKSTYGTITVADMGPIIEAVVQEDNVKYETTVVLDGGKKLAAVLRVDEPFQIPGDPSATYPYASVLNSFDGSTACKVNRTTVRVVCANTFAAAEAEGQRSGLQFTFRHTKNWRDRVEDARRVINATRAEAQEWRELATQLSLLHVDEVQTRRFIAEFIPSPVEALISDRVAANVEEARAAIRAILASPTCDGIRDTAYGLVQASGEYLDHVRKARSDATLFGRQLLRPEPLKARAVKLVREVVAA